MASDSVTPERYRAGADYLAALIKNGVKPDGMFWAERDSTRSLELIIITILVDRVGPKDIYDTLFKAYDSAITPRSIDPWLVTLFAPDTIFAQSMAGSMGADFKPPQMQVRETGGEFRDVDPAEFSNMHMGFGYSVDDQWIYIRPRKRQLTVQAVQSWERFARKVDRAAA